MKQRLPQSLGAFMGYFLKPHKIFSVAFAGCAIVSGLWAPINSWLIKYIIDNLGNLTQDSLASVMMLPSLLLVVNYEVHNLTWRIMEYLKYKVQPVLKNRIIHETFAYVMMASHQFFQDHLSGRIASQITTLADNIEKIIHELSRFLIRGSVLLLSTFVSMYFIHPFFFYVLLVWFVVFVVFCLCMSRYLIHLAGVHAGCETTVSGCLVDSITNNSNVRIFSRVAYELLYLERVTELTKIAFCKKEMFALKYHFIQGLSLSLMLALMLYFLVRLRVEHLVSAGDFAFILGLSLEVGFMTWWTMEQVDEINKAVGKARQSLKHLLIPLDVVDHEGAKNLCAHKGRIVFHEVTFRFKETSPLFENKSVTIEPGQKVGCVGYSGSGKSTFVNLILRLYDVTVGRICIDDQDIRLCTQDSLRSHIAMIPQDPSLFHRSLMENIRYGCVDASDEEVIEAAKRANAHDFIEKLPLKYESLVGERGVKLSGGQRQRIAIARAILKNSPILILDEATSSLDSVTESELQESLWRLMNGKTAIVIAHRLSTLLHMDRILVFDEGKIVEDGIHEELLKREGLYKTLWEAQVGGFLPNKKGEKV